MTQVYTITFRIPQGDVYEVPCEARSYTDALRRVLAWFGLRRNEVIVCL